jgi:hypothetical protein
MYKFFIRCLLAWSVWLPGQIGWAKTSIKSYLPTGLQIGVDLANPIYYYLYKKTGPIYELNALVDFKRLLVQGDYGWGIIERKGVSTKIKDIRHRPIKSACYNLGYYFRIGVDYNFIKNSLDDNAAFLGVRYAKSYFYDILQSTLPSKTLKEGAKSNKVYQVWDDYFLRSEQYDMQARWFEVVAGFRVKVWEWTYLGGTARYQLNKKLTDRKGHIPFDIVGWGINSEDAFHVNIYLGVRLPLQKRIAVEKGIKPAM